MAEIEKSERRKSLIQFLKFGLVGISNTVVNYVIYAIIIYCYGLEYYVAASIVAFVISVLNAYVWQNIFVFREEAGGEKRVWWKVLLKTYAAYSFTGLILSNILLYLWIDVVDISRFAEPVLRIFRQLGIVMTARELAAYGAPVLNMVVTIPLNFVINKFWAYRQKEKREER